MVHSCVQSSDEVTCVVRALVVGTCSNVCSLATILVLKSTTVTLVIAIIQLIVPIHVNVKLRQWKHLLTDLILLGQIMWARPLVIEDISHLAIKTARVTSTTSEPHTNIVLMCAGLLLSTSNEVASEVGVRTVKRSTSLVSVSVLKVGNGMSTLSVHLLLNWIKNLR